MRGMVLVGFYGGVLGLVGCFAWVCGLVGCRCGVRCWRLVGSFFVLFFLRSFFLVLLAMVGKGACWVFGQRGWALWGCCVWLLFVAVGSLCGVVGLCRCLLLGVSVLSRCGWLLVFG